MSETESDQEKESDSPAAADNDDLAVNTNDDSRNKSDQQGNENSAGDYQFDVIEGENISRLMYDMIREVTNVAMISPTIARALLNYFRWDTGKLMERYYDGDREKLFEEAHIVEATGQTGTNEDAVGKSKDECEICLKECPNSKLTGLECEHKFCGTCWSQYLTTRIMEHGMAQTISCAAHDCGVLVDDNMVMKVVQDEKVKSRYQQLITNNFVESNKLLRWCPSKDCPNAVRVQYPAAKPVRCKCGYEFCFNCGHEWHDPVNCTILRIWIKKCNEDSETSNWLAANTKECPKCHVAVEKDGGCNHMTCNCNFEYCWLCLGPWHCSQCDRFDDANVKAARDAQEKSRAILRRYLHYCNRYMNHMESLKFENELYTAVSDRMDEMQQHGMSWIDVQFLRNAVDVLVDCRRTLMYTYAFAYYVNKNDQVELFKANQNDLEMATAQLSEFLERDLDKADLGTLKQSVQDKYKYCEKRRKALLDHCHEGDDNDWWKFDASDDR